VIGCLSPAAWFDSSFALPAPVLKNLPLLAVIYKAWLWRINKVKLYRPATGEQDAWPGLAPALTRPIRWDRVAEAILRRFMKANAAHPTYQAMIELGRAQKTIFLARYPLQPGAAAEIHEGFNVVESWNRANTVIFYGKGSDLASNHRDEQEMSVLCLRILQAALVYVNTLMLQDCSPSPTGTS
jgi:hypothetical protein